VNVTLAEPCSLENGMTFAIREDSKTVGHATVTRITP
jgi:translation elongation factor EF-Tu-like GTPase